MSTYEQLLAECQHFARAARDVEEVTQWLDNPLDVDFVCDAYREYRAGRLYLALGGPTIYVDTRTETVEGRWWSDSVSVPCDTDMVDDELRARWEEYFV